MSLRFDHYLSTNGTSSSHSGAASSAQLIQAAASFMQEHFAGAFPELAKDPNQKPQAPSKSKAHKAADTKQTPAQLSPAPRLLAQSKRISLYRSYQTKLRRAWHDAKPADLVQLDTDLRSELQSDTAIVHMVHRSILGETLLDCLSMSYQMTRVDPVGVPQVTYSRGARNGRCLRIPSNPEVADQIANPFRSNGSLMVTFTLQILSRTPQLLPSLPPALRQILFTCCLRTIFAEVCAEEAHASYEAAYCSLGRNLDSILILLLHIALLDPEVCRKVVCNHRIRSAAADDHFQGISTFPTLWAVVEWIESKPWQHPSTCCGGDTTAEHLPLDIVDGFQLSAAALLHTLGLFPPHIVSPFKTDNLNSILDYFRSKPDFVRSSEIIACGYCGVIKKPDSATNDDKQFSQSQGSTDHFVRCGGCLAVNYCSNACAKLDWSNKPGSGGDHKQHCSRITKDPLGDVVATGADL